MEWSFIVLLVHIAGRWEKANPAKKMQLCLGIHVIMKIYKLPVDSILRPSHQEYLWPPANQRSGWDYGVEQDFEWWLDDREDILVDDIEKADWLYLPVYWNRYYINTPDKEGRWGGGVELLEECVHDALGYGIPTFTISEADEKVLHSEINWGSLLMFVASRRGDIGIDIPLLSGRHDFPDDIPYKKWLASFVGNLATDGIRIDMRTSLQRRNDCLIEHGEYGEEYFVNLMLESYIALCPRGTGGQSFRMYEAMQLGTVPMYISDMDCRPFKNWIDWDICSFWVNSTDKLNEYIGCLGAHTDKLLKMGELAKATFDDHLGYGKWCKFVIRELELI